MQRMPLHDYPICRSILSEAVVIRARVHPLADTHSPQWIPKNLSVEGDTRRRDSNTDETSQGKCDRNNEYLHELSVGSTLKLGDSTPIPSHFIVYKLTLARSSHNAITYNSGKKKTSLSQRLPINASRTYGKIRYINSQCAVKSQRTI